MTAKDAAIHGCEIEGQAGLIVSPVSHAVRGIATVHNTLRNLWQKVVALSRRLENRVYLLVAWWRRSVVRASGLGLTIHSVGGGDAGRYHCVITRFGKQPTRSESGPPLRLVVNATPKVISPTNHQISYSKIGDSLSIECRAEGVPPPEITWLKDGKIVNTGSVLNITNLEKHHEGHYHCLAVNVEGKAKSQIELRFSKVPTFDFVPTNKTVVQGSNVFWRCQADAQSENVHYSWTFGGQPVKTTETGLRAEVKEGDFSLRDVRKEDRGYYECIAQSPSGERSQVSAFLDVLYPPLALPSHRQVLTIGYGQNGTIQCAVDANPAPSHYMWSKNGHFLLNTAESSLLIKAESDSDGGIFGCQAENSVGRSSILETHVVIAEPPVFIKQPPPELRVFEGAPAEVVCDGFGDPLPIVYWIHSKRRISSAVLSFASVSFSDHGTYECVVSNAVSSISSTMKLIVDRTRPQSAVIENVECMGDEAMTVSWTPGFNGSYAQSFILHYSSDDDPLGKSLLTTSTTATIGDLKAFSKYRIHVESRNQKGSTNSTAVEKHVCSTLPSPTNLRLSRPDELRWDPVAVAMSYRVESRYDKMSAFERVGEVLDPVFELRPDFRLGRSFRVRSLRDPYEPSMPSETLTLGSYGYGPPSMWWAVFGGFLFFFLFTILYLYSKYGKYLNRRHKKNKQFNDYVCSTSFQQRSETVYAESINPTEDTRLGHWHDYKDENFIQHQSQELLDYGYAEDSNSMVHDMLRDKYMYGADDVPVQLMNDLRIEKLRREFKQSQL
ncbi:unnamed protein product [Cylicocyclus nassatus]|uniref:Uncharacterized protein n=1 Tax=Cylicocyclus nassatus TaxID=53992 RepID=A0AA36HH39_CYLNA|nr:unnamed protein product [Cylicocyclus nassatus]